MSSNIEKIVNVSLSEPGSSIGNDNMNVVAILTSDDSVLSSVDRYRIYTQSSSAEAEFGTLNPVTQFVQSSLNQSPNPVKRGGSIVVGYWRAVDEVVPATSATLTSGQFNESIVVSALQQVTDGSFSITTSVSNADYQDIDFSSVSSLDDIRYILDQLTVDLSWSISDDNTQTTATELTTGETSIITVMSPTGTGSFIGDILLLSAGSGSTVKDGEDSATLTAESKVDALSELKRLINFKGAMFIDAVLDAEVPQIAPWADANSVIFYDVFTGDDYLEKDVSNPVWVVKTSGQSNYRCLYYSSDNRKMATAYMGRNHVVNFSSENSAITMAWKELNGIPLDQVVSDSDTIMAKCQEVGLDCYIGIKDNPKLYVSGANDFVDNVYNLMHHIDAVQVAAANVISGTSTKIGQATIGVSKITDAVESVCAQDVRANFLSPGTWNSPDSFGNIDTFNASIEAKGYYVLANSLATQPVVDREARKSPAIQEAIKFAGAIHSVDILINYNR